MDIRYVLMNPTGNRTILVESPVPRKDYAKTAALLMKKQPTAEQVGFVDFTRSESLKLEMAGGEFCGNASMCAGVLAVKRGLAKEEVALCVSGAKEPVSVKVTKNKGLVSMPGTAEVTEKKLTLEEKEYLFPVVKLPGITHVIIRPRSFAKSKAKKAAALWCKQLKADSLGLLFVNQDFSEMTPFVYVPSPMTAVWENSCGSGSVALAAFLSEKNPRKKSWSFKEPGGVLKVRKEGETFRLEGTVVLEKEETLTSSPEPEKPVKKAAKKSGKKAAQEAGEKTGISKNRVEEVLTRLDEQYGTEYKCYLNHDNAWQLLFATILSAQCTDERVNLVTKDLFVKYPSPEAFANADLKEFEQDIRSTGFYHNKAKNIIACAKELVEKYGGEVPSDLESLTALPGVGRKTANVIRGNIYHIDSIVVDTHVKRISNKLGFTTQEDPVRIEFDLMDKLPKDHWILYNIHIIRLGRTICKAPTPKCEECFLRDLCPSARSR